MASIQKRILDLKRKYLLTTSDMAVMLCSNRSTVGAWERGVTPSPTKYPQIKQRLSIIELAARKKPCPFPIPLQITQYQRKSYLLGAIDVLAFRVPKQSASTGR
jgi:hypothetical protein